MKIEDFDFILPEKLIAQKALNQRDSSKMLFFDKKNNEKKDLLFKNLVDLVDENYVLVFNKSKVIPARIKFEINEILLSKKRKSEDFQWKNNENKWKFFWEAIIFPWKRFKLWKKFLLNWVEIEVLEIKNDWLRILSFKKIWDWKFDFNFWLEKVWELPLPPYIKEKTDPKKYQTIFSDTWNSVAAPTAGLHFTEDLLLKLKNKWVQLEFVHLDVWLWTFLPIKCDEIKEHKMHSELFFIDWKTAERLNKAKKNWKKIIAVWTTSVRVLETVAGLNNWKLKEYYWETDIFIYKWYKRKFIDELITNFHLPKTTLLMLVSAFIWKENILKLYKNAVEKKYRFYSFWDAMYLKK